MTHHPPTLKIILLVFIFVLVIILVLVVILVLNLFFLQNKASKNRKPLGEWRAARAAAQLSLLCCSHIGAYMYRVRIGRFPFTAEMCRTNKTKQSKAKQNKIHPTPLSTMLRLIYLPAPSIEARPSSDARHTAHDTRPRPRPWPKIKTLLVLRVKVKKKTTNSGEMLPKFTTCLAARLFPFFMTNRGVYKTNTIPHHSPTCRV